MARAEIVKKGNFVNFKLKPGTQERTHVPLRKYSCSAKLTAKVLLKKGLSKIHKPPFKDFSQEFQDDVQ